eukprot:2481103-Prymnesium_polylepis.1
MQRCAAARGAGPLQCRAAAGASDGGARSTRGGGRLRQRRGAAAAEATAVLNTAALVGKRLAGGLLAVQAGWQNRQDLGVGHGVARG